MIINRIFILHSRGNIKNWNWVISRGRKNDDWMWSWIGLHFAITSKTKLIARVWRHQSNQKLDWIAFLLDCKSNHACAIKCNQKCNIFTSDCAIETKMIAQAEKNDCNPKWGRKINKFWISKSGQYIFDWWVIKCQYNLSFIKTINKNSIVHLFTISRH